ncbi:hypothetical protein NXW91_23705 [Bacteroides fragilis]|nr:hypothetical protein [Bacteroides fragilis]
MNQAIYKVNGNNKLIKGIDVDKEERMLTNVMHQIKKGKLDVLGKAYIGMAGWHL